MWTLHKQQQHCGAQLHARSGKTRQPGDEVPEEATRDRDAQEHDHAGDETLPSGDYPASPVENRDDDPLPRAPGETRLPDDGVIKPNYRQAR